MNINMGLSEVVAIWLVLCLIITTALLVNELSAHGLRRHSLKLILLTVVVSLVLTTLL